MQNNVVSIAARAGYPAVVAFVVACNHDCPAGNPCTLDGGSQHLMHVCENPGCACHSRERYTWERRYRAVGK